MYMLSLKTMKIRKASAEITRLDLNTSIQGHGSPGCRLIPRARFPQAPFYDYLHPDAEAKKKVYPRYLLYPFHSGLIVARAAFWGYPCDTCRPVQVNGRR